MLLGRSIRWMGRPDACATGAAAPPRTPDSGKPRVAHETHFLKRLSPDARMLAISSAASVGVRDPSARSAAAPACRPRGVPATASCSGMRAPGAYRTRAGRNRWGRTGLARTLRCGDLRRRRGRDSRQRRTAEGHAFRRPHLSERIAVHRRRPGQGLGSQGSRAAF